MKSGKEILLMIIGGAGWLWLGVTYLLAGAAEQSIGSIVCVVALTVGIAMVTAGMDKLLTPKQRW